MTVTVEHAGEQRRGRDVTGQLTDDEETVRARSLLVRNDVVHETVERHVLKAQEHAHDQSGNRHRPEAGLGVGSRCGDQGPQYHPGLTSQDPGNPTLPAPARETIYQQPPHRLQRHTQGEQGYDQAHLNGRRFTANQPRGERGLHVAHGEALGRAQEEHRRVPAEPCSPAASQAGSRTRVDGSSERTSSTTRTPEWSESENFSPRAFDTLLLSSTMALARGTNLPGIDVHSLDQNIIDALGGQARCGPFRLRGLAGSQVTSLVPGCSAS